jgi:hypothetical protein
VRCVFLHTFLPVAHVEQLFDARNGRAGGEAQRAVAAIDLEAELAQFSLQSRDIIAAHI